MVCDPTCTAAAAAPNRWNVRRRSSATSGSSTGKAPASISPSTGSISSIQLSAEAIDSRSGRSGGATPCAARSTPNATRPSLYAGSMPVRSSPLWRATTSAPNASRSTPNSASSLSNCDKPDTPRGYGAATRRDCPRWHHLRDAPPLPRWRDDRHGFPVPARYRPGQGPHRLRDVPGQPERVGSQPRAVRVRAVGAGRGRAHPCPPRPLRASPRARPRGLLGADPLHRRDCRARTARDAGLGQAARAIRETRGALGEAAP